MRIFVSSTAYDLLDIRAEVEAHLRSLGFSPVMSDSRQSEFDVKHPTNSIETCLINLRDCEVVIVILDKRYGPSLKSSGIAEVSATHLEYREAVKENLPVCFYVRDRLEADYRHWRQEKDESKRKAMTFPWVKKGDEQLFEFLNERQMLEANAKRSNWFMTFRDSIQLKEMISRDLSARAGRLRLEDALRNSRVPTVSAKLRMIYLKGLLEAHIDFTNAGSSPIIQMSWQLWAEPKSDNPYHFGGPYWLGPGETASIPFFADTDSVESLSELTMHYRTADGFHVKDLYEIVADEFLFADGRSLIFDFPLRSRQFAPPQENDEMPFLIVDRID